MALRLLVELLRQCHKASGVARLTAFFLLLFAAFSALMIHRAGKRWDSR